MPQIDKRIVRTREALYQALEQLAISTNDYRDITVTQLTELAGINRKTFYLHYNSIDDLVDEYADIITQKLGHIIQAHTFKEVSAHPGLLLMDFADYVNAHNAAAQRLLFSDDYSRFTKRIERNLSVILAENIRESFPMTAQDASIAAYFVIHNTLALYNYFLKQARKDDVFDRQTFRDYVVRLNLSGLSTFFKTN